MQQSSNSTYCVTDLLTKVQTALGTDLTVSTLTSLDLASLEKIPSSDVCDDCAHALTTKLVPILDSASSSSSATTGGSSASSAGSASASAAASTTAASGAAARKAKRQSSSSVSTSDLSSAISSYCGSSFLDGQIPSGIQEGSGSNSSSSSGNNAVSSTSLSGAADLSASSWSKVVGIAAAGLAGAAVIA